MCGRLRAARSKLKTVCTMLDGRMDGARKSRGTAGKLAAAAAMVRCACTFVAFEEIARRLRGGQDLEQAQFETGVGLLCTACIPDLRDHLAAALTDEEKGAAKMPGRFS